MTEKKNIILDLDNTVISSIPLEEVKWTSDLDKKMKRFNFCNMEDYYIIFERPFLQDFLDELFANYNVSVWSAGSKDYVLHIVEMIILKKPERKLDFIFFSYHCGLSRKLYNGIKDLRLVYDTFGMEGYTKDNTFIIDDLKKVKKINQDNCIAIKDFEFYNDGSEKDNSLIEISHELQKI
jgi:hypothetical protein